MFAVNIKEIFKFKVNNKNVIFETQFSLGSISNGFAATDSRKAFSKRNVCNFSANYNAIVNSDKLNIHYHLMVKNNTKYKMFELIM